MTARPRINEVDFCGQVASAANLLIQDERIAPFDEVRLEGYGTGVARSKRKDLRFYDRRGRLVLCGEVKLPGTPEGRSPLNQKLMADAAAKADDAGVQYFFTWNVNEFALWDRSLWDRPWLERRVRMWRLPRTLLEPEDVAREENLEFIKTRFLPDLLRELAEIISGRRRDWAMPPDDMFIRALESHLDWPVQLARVHILEHSRKNKTFDLRVQRWMTEQDWTFVRSDDDEWVHAIENMAKTLAYVWANRLIFYKALRARFPELARLELRTSVRTPEQALAAFNRFFKRAVDRSGDYEPLLMPDAKDWAIDLVFQPASALDAWRGLLRGIELVDFREVPSDVVGRIFQKLIGPDERHRYGQHFTGDDIVDVINGFCIHTATDTVLDPACGSGSFLVRAYYRKRQLDPARMHLDLIAELFGCDIALYPAHLATLNLAAREINEEANYPRIARRNFFDFAPPEPFCHLPDVGAEHQPIPLPTLDVVVGNPPYVRQEKVDKKDKARFAKVAESAWPGLRMTRRSDLHCYFWPAAARLLKSGGYFGFLTSSSWLDVEYGFALQGWMLRHFRIVAIMESAAEPWFEDARVKTSIAILQRCDNESDRTANRVRFVRFTRKLADIIRVPSTAENENARQAAIEELRERILSADTDVQTDDWRIIVKNQADLWADGVRAAEILADAEEPTTFLDSEEEDGDEGLDGARTLHDGGEPATWLANAKTDEYRAGKWGRYLRAPDVYFDFMRRFSDRFVPLGAIASIRRGITSGCDAFFMPRDVTATVLASFEADRDFRAQTGGAPRCEVESGRLRIVEAGDGSTHAIETKYLAPELHSLMQVDRPVVRSADLDRVVVLVGEPLDELKRTAPWVARYLRYGMTAAFASKKSKPVSIPRRSTCAARDPWYDLTHLIKPGFVLWPKAQQYRHIIPANPDRIISNCNLYDLISRGLNPTEEQALVAVLNSTLVGLFKTFYGRFAGTEGNLKTEVVDVNLLEVPDPRGIPNAVALRLHRAWERMCTREVGRLVEEQLMDCHTPERARRLAASPLLYSEELQQGDRRELDDAVLELLGVSDAAERGHLILRLYSATANHFRQIRVVEIEKMEQRAKTKTERFSLRDLAADIWDAAELEDLTALAEWVDHHLDSDAVVNIPDEHPAVVVENPLFDEFTVFFGSTRKKHETFRSRAEAELVAHLANQGVNGALKIPSQPAACRRLLEQSEVRLATARTRFEELAESRTGDERVRRQLVEVLEGWFVHGHNVMAA